MADFIATINLHNASEEDYRLLRAALHKEEFKEAPSRSARPATGEYSRSGNINIQQVIQSVLKATRITGKDYSFTVINRKNRKH